MKSILSFDHYDVIETIYRFDPNSKLESEDVKPDLALKIKYLDKNRDKAVLFFSIELGDRDLKKNSFYIKAVIVGFFSLLVDDATDKDFVDHLYKKNALAILYPYMRALVSDLSSRGSENPIILPTMNIGAMIEKEGILVEEYSDEIEQN